MKIDVRMDITRATESLRNLKADMIGGATVRALNKTADQVKTAAAGEIQRVYAIKVSAAKSRIDVSRASRARLQAVISASGKRLGLVDFTARQTAKGVTVKVLQAGGRKLVEHAFIIPTKGAKYRSGVFLRDTKSRYPIHFLLSVGVAQAFRSKPVQEKLMQLARDRFQIVIQQEFNFSIIKAGLKN